MAGGRSGSTVALKDQAGAGFKSSDAFPQNGYKITHDVSDRIFDPKKIRIEITLADGVTDLPFQTRIQLVLGDRFQHRAVLIRLGVIRIQSDAGGFRGDGDLVYFLPGKFEMG